jgi:hypothetical protein
MDRERTQLAGARAFIFSAALVLALSFAIAWPIWFFATGCSGGYTIAVAGAVAFLVALSVIRALRRRRSAREGRRAA